MNIELSMSARKAFSAVTTNLATAFLINIIPLDNVIFYTSPIFWGAIGGLVRALVEAKTEGQNDWRLVLINGWHYILIGSLVASAMNGSVLPVVGDYLAPERMPARSVHFLTGAFAAVIFAAAEDTIQFFLKVKKSSGGAT